MKKSILVMMATILIIGCWHRVAGQDLGNIKTQKPFTIHGSLGLNMIAYGVSGIPAREQPFSFVFSANATASIYGIELPFSVVISDKQKNYSQPFNQFGLSPHWKWITAYLGYRNVSWSQFTLAGHTFLGAGVELNPGLFRFGFIWGRFDRSTTTNPVNTTDSLPNFSRKGYCMKIGVGSEKNFADLIVLRIHDDSTSISQADTSTIRTPEQNVVTGLNTRFTLAKALTWETELAFSLFTTDMGAAEISDIEDNSLLSSMNKFFVVNQSSNYSTAVRTALAFKGKGYSLKLEYRRIAPTYQSMGAYFFNNDLENITFSPAFGMFKRKVSVSGSVGAQHDNLQKAKLATSWRYIGNVNLSVNPSPKWGVDAGFNNYSINQKPGRLPLSDTLKVVQTNRTVTLTPRVMLVSTEISHVIMLNYTYTSYADQNKYTKAFANFDLHTGQLNYVLGLIPTRWSFTAGLTWTRLVSQVADNTGFGGTFSVSKSLFEDRMNIALNNAVAESNTEDITTWIFNSNLITTYRAGKHHSFRLNIYLTGNYPGSGSPNPSFTEYKGDISYVFTF